jgi:hypothetical protein
MFLYVQCMCQYTVLTYSTHEYRGYNIKMNKILHESSTFDNKSLKDHQL